MKTKNLVYMALFITLGLVLPIFFHYAGPGLGSMFLPMHIPVLLAGLLCGPAAGIVVGLLTPVLSSMLTGMPPLLPMVPIMVVELAVYGLLGGYLYFKKEFNIYISLIIVMLVGRAAAGIVVFFLVNVFGFGGLPVNPFVYVWGIIIKGLPGIIIQLILIPLLAGYLQGKGFFQENNNPDDKSV